MIKIPKKITHVNTGTEFKPISISRFGEVKMKQLNDSELETKKGSIHIIHNDEIEVYNLYIRS